MYKIKPILLTYYFMIVVKFKVASTILLRW